VYLADTSFVEMSERLHRGFSPARIFAISINTLIELTRQKVFYVLLIFALLLIGCSVPNPERHFARRDIDL
jgi:hypothetical protein